MPKSHIMRSELPSYAIILSISEFPTAPDTLRSASPTVPCAVDIEPLARDFGRAAVRFASAEERQLSDSPLLLPALWCAKETLYKYSGRRNLDLLRDLRIERFDPDEGRMTGRICGESALEIGLRREEELLAAYILV